MLVDYQDIALFHWLFYIVVTKQEQLLAHSAFMVAFYEFSQSFKK